MSQKSVVSVEATIPELEAATGLPIVTVDHPDLSQLLAAHEDSPALIRATGSIPFDAAVAAALGAPLVLDTTGVTGELNRQEAERRGATVIPAEGDVVKAVEEATATPQVSPESFERFLTTKAAASGAHIVLPEGEDDRILAAAAQLKGIVELTILGDVDAITARARELELDLSEVHLVDPSRDPRAEEFAEAFAQLRKKKGVTLEQARETMKDISYFATMMIQLGYADGMVSGAAHTTAHTIRPALQVIKTVPEASIVSSIFLMVLPGKLWAFGDCAVNTNPTAQQLGEIAVVSARTAASFGIDPKVAMLSYSTIDSGSGPDVDRALEALEQARSLDPALAVDGPLQFDAAVTPEVALKKAPESPVAGHATVFVFPDLEAGNIAYKAVQRTSGALAIGPILQGLRKPVNDLSRGATVPDIVNTVAVTAIQAKG